MNLDEKIAQAEQQQQERALEVRDAVIAAARAEVEPVAEPVKEA